MKSNGLISYILGALLVLTMALLGIIYTNIDNRLTRIEQNIATIQGQYSQITEIRIKVIYMQRDIQVIIDRLGKP